MFWVLEWCRVVERGVFKYFRVMIRDVFVVENFVVSYLIVIRIFSMIGVGSNS